VNIGVWLTLGLLALFIAIVAVDYRSEWVPRLRDALRGVKKLDTHQFVRTLAAVVVAVAVVIGVVVLVGRREPAVDLNEERTELKRTVCLAERAAITSLNATKLAEYNSLVAERALNRAIDELGELAGERTGGANWRPQPLFEPNLLPLPNC